MNRFMQTLFDPFNSNSPTGPKEAMGGSRPQVQAQHDDATSVESAPLLTSQIYHSGALKMYDPQEGGKSDNVENIYLPPSRSAETAGDKSQAAPGVAQPFNFLKWLKTGVG